eukprot:tig00000448_g917.t1
MLKKADIDEVSLLHAAIRALRKDRTSRADKEVQDKFNASVGQVIESLEADLEGQENILLREADSTHARFLLFDLCFAELVDHATANLDAELAAVLRRFRRSHQQLFARLPSILHETFPPGSRIKEAPEMGAEPYDDARQHSAGAARNGSPSVHSPSRPNGILRGAPAPVAIPAPAPAPRQQEAAPPVGPGGYAWRHAQLPREDSQKTERGPGGRWAQPAVAVPGPGAGPVATEEADDEGEEAPEARPLSTAPVRPQLYPYPRPLLEQPAPAPAGPQPRPARSGVRSAPSTARAASKPGARRAASQERPPRDPDARSSAHASDGEGAKAQAQARRREPSAERAQVTPRPISHKQLSAIIESIYASKEEFDAKCARAQLPRETMEQHMFTYLNQKYGLRPLVLEYAAGVVKAAGRLAAVDNDVAVFHRILRNEIDEDFRRVQRSLKETLADLLRLHLSNKFALKSERELQAMLQARMRGSVSEPEWLEVVRAAYEGRDAEHVEAIVRRVQQNVAEASGEAANRIPYAEFLKTCLEYQLRGHEAFLRPFVRLFRAVDSDRDGVITGPQFRQLVRSLDPASPKPEAQVQELLARADPHDNQQITFSECVSVLEQELLAFSSRLQEQRSRPRS